MLRFRPVYRPHITRSDPGVGRGGITRGLASEVRIREAEIAPRSQSEAAYLSIRDRILSLAMPPGSLVHEARLQEELSIGRTPIREALQRFTDRRAAD